MEDKLEGNTFPVNKELNTKETHEEPSPKLWADIICGKDIICGNRMSSNEATIEFVAPNLVEEDIEVNIDEYDIESEVKFWDSALIMYVIGKDLSMNAVMQYMVIFWSFVQLPNLYYHNEGYFLLKFKSHKDIDLIVMRGSYTIQNMPTVIKY